MINFFFEPVNNAFKAKKKSAVGFYKITKLIVNLFYPLINFSYRKRGIDENSNIIISLTTFPDRINYVWVTIVSLLRQSQKPAKVVLWLANEQFPDKKLPKNLVKLCKCGLEIHYCDDLKPHKKYYYSMKKWPDKYILTCDDDMFYPENLVEILWKDSIKHEGMIICNNSINVIYDKNGEFIRRDSWYYKKENKEGLQVCPVGCGGVLYPPRSLNEKAFDKKALMEDALCQDDVWLKGMAVLNKTPACNTGKYYHNFFNNVFTQKGGLWRSNLIDEKDIYSPNEMAWLKMTKRYPEIEKILKEDYNILIETNF